MSEDEVGAAVMGHIIKALRAAQEVNQKALATMVGVNQATVSRWEHGIIAPGPTELKKIAESFEIPLAVLKNLAKKAVEEFRIARQN